ncbi:MAG: CIA30 family protein, partial [Planctomycetes bacterium]|nr:CIA30 family protein [Planctomycetota bacterium]
HGASVLAHGVFVGAVDDALASAMKTRGVAYVPTLSVVLGSKRAGSERSPYAHELTLGALGAELYENVASGHGSTWATSGDFAAGDRQWLANLKTLADAGVLLGTGTDAGNPLTPHGPALLEELALFVEAGLSPARTLRAATLDSARILGVERDFGSLAPGKIADVVVVRGEPSTTISDVWNVVDVFKSGVPFDRAAHARRLAAQAAGPAKARVGSDVPARIDDFDDGDVRSAYATEWTAASDTVAGGKSSATIAVRDGVLRVDGELRAGFAYGPFAGVALRFDATAERVADDDERAADDDERALGGGARAADPGERVLDAGDYDGVRLRVRGTERSWSFTLNRAAVKDFNGFATSLELGPEWKDVEIPFRTLQQLGVGKPVPWGAGDLVGLEIDARVPWGSNELGEFEFELDWIEFYRTP